MSLGIIGAAGPARWELISVGAVVVVLGALVHLITLEEHAHHTLVDAATDAPDPAEAAEVVAVPPPEGADPEQLAAVAEPADPDPSPRPRPPLEPAGPSLGDPSLPVPLAAHAPRPAPESDAAHAPPNEESKPSRVVTFRLPAIEGVWRVEVVGDFNEWTAGVHVLGRRDDHFSTEISLPLGRAYRYRYLLDGTRWENDWTADAYLPNAFGTEDSVVDLTDDHAPTPRADAGDRPSPGGEA